MLNRVRTYLGIDTKRRLSAVVIILLALASQYSLIESCLCSPARMSIAGHCYCCPEGYSPMAAMPSGKVSTAALYAGPAEAALSPALRFVGLRNTTDSPLCVLALWQGRPAGILSSPSNSDVDWSESECMAPPVQTDPFPILTKSKAPPGMTSRPIYFSISSLLI